MTLVDSPDYLKALKRERDRERHRRQTEQGTFEATFVSLDAITANEDADAGKDDFLSDHGLGAVIATSFDSETPEAETSRRYKAACERVRRHAPNCLETFKLIVKNGKHRKDSICEQILNDFITSQKKNSIYSKAILTTFSREVLARRVSATSGSARVSASSSASTLRAMKS